MFIIVGMYHKLQSVFTKESRRAGNPEQLACFLLAYLPAQRGISSDIHPCIVLLHIVSKSCELQANHAGAHLFGCYLLPQDYPPDVSNTLVVIFSITVIFSPLP